MTGLSYPFIFECDNCGKETTITREDARDCGLDPEKTRRSMWSSKCVDGWTARGATSSFARTAPMRQKMRSQDCD